MNASAIGERVNLSVTAVIERIKKMERANIIMQYTAIINPAQIGKELIAFISVSLEHPKYNEIFEETINQNPDIVECHYITGDFDFILKVYTGSSKMLESLLNFIKSIKGVSLTRTLLVLSTVKDDISALPPEIV